MPSSLAVRHVLLVDDNDGDASLVRTAAEPFASVEITHVLNGGMANRYLFNLSPFEDCPKPDLVLLDLNMPALHGSVVLQFMRESPEHRDTPVVILTGSSRERERCRALGANEFIVKPAQWPEWEALMRGVFRRFLYPTP